MNTEQRTLLTMSELADYLKCTTRHIQNLMGRGLPYIQVSERMVRFDLERVNEWMADRTSTAPAKAANA